VLIDEPALQAAWSERVRRLEEGKLNADAAARAQLLAYEAEVRRRQSQTQAEIASLRQQLQTLHESGPLQRERLALVKDDFRDVASLALANDDVYAALKQTPEAQQSLKEFVQLRVYEAMRAHTLRTEPLRAECVALRERCADAEAKADAAARECARAQKSAADISREARRDADQLEARCVRLADECGALQTKANETAAALQRYEAVRARLDALEAEHARVCAQQAGMRGCIRVGDISNIHANNHDMSICLTCPPNSLC
jgi:hypothetical protein